MMQGLEYIQHVKGVGNRETGLNNMILQFRHCVNLLCEGFGGCEGHGHVFSVVDPEIESGVVSRIDFELFSRLKHI